MVLLCSLPNGKDSSAGSAYSADLISYQNGGKVGMVIVGEVGMA